MDPGMELIGKIRESAFGVPARRELRLLGKESMPARSSGWNQVGMVFTSLAKGENWYAWKEACRKGETVADDRGLETRSREFTRMGKYTMRLYVENIPPLANEEALTKWFERSGLRVESMEFIQGEASRRCARVKIESEKFPSKALRHLSGCTFWGRYLEVRNANCETKGNLRHRSDPWAKLLAA